MRRSQVPSHVGTVLYSGGKNILTRDVDQARSFRVGVVAQALRTADTRAVVSSNGVKDKTEMLSQGCTFIITYLV